MKSNRPDIIKLANLINTYMNSENNSIAKATLLSMRIEGSDLMDAFDNINEEFNREKYNVLKGEYEDLKANYEGTHKYYEQQNEDQKKLINALESILEEPFIQKIINIPKILKEVKYP